MSSVSSSCALKLMTWRQHRIDVQNLLESLLLDTVTPAPIVGESRYPVRSSSTDQGHHRTRPSEQLLVACTGAGAGIRRASAEGC